MRRYFALSLILPMTITLAGCERAPAVQPMANGLLLSLAVLESGPSGPIPQPAQLGIVTHDGNAWNYRFIEDADSNVFHKAMVFTPANGAPSLVTAGGTKAMVKLWAADGSTETLWEKDFGGKFSRMRDLEVADINADGHTDIVVATHDQGVVAVLFGDGAGGFLTATRFSSGGRNPHYVTTGDFNSDGNADLAVAKKASTNSRRLPERIPTRSPRLMPRP